MPPYLVMPNLLYLVLPNMASLQHHIIMLLGDDRLNTRRLELGDRNIIGSRVTEMRKKLGLKQVDLLAKLQVRGVDISPPALSLLEGQKRPVSDIELNALADIFGVSADWLLGRE